MSEDLRLKIERRTKFGKVQTQRLRAAGMIPANIYGLGKPGESVSVPRDLVEKLVATRSSVVDIELDGSIEKAVVQELQWDVFSTAVQHLDLRRVNAAAKTKVDVALEVKGEPAGLKEGGVIRHHAKTVTIECPEYRIPKSIQVRIGALSLGGVVTAGELTLPEHATLVTAKDSVLIELHDSRKAG